MRCEDQVQLGTDSGAGFSLDPTEIEVLRHRGPNELGVSMKIVVFGPEKRVGVLQDAQIVDLNHGMSEYLRQRGESNPEQKAAERVPARLLAFIERGAPAIEASQRVLEHSSGVGDREHSRLFYEATSVKIHAPWPERRIACVG